MFRDLDGERDQLWAEAVARWRMGEALHLTPDLEVVARAIQEEHRARHPWKGWIADFLDQEIPAEWSRWDLPQRQAWRGGGVKHDGATAPRTRVCAAGNWCEALGKQRGDMRQRFTEIEAFWSVFPDGKRKPRKLEPYGTQRCLNENDYRWGG